DAEQGVRVLVTTRGVAEPQRTIEIGQARDRLVARAGDRQERAERIREVLLLQPGERGVVILPRGRIRRLPPARDARRRALAMRARGLRRLRELVDDAAVAAQAIEAPPRVEATERVLFRQEINLLAQDRRALGRIGR